MRPDRLQLFAFVWRCRHNQLAAIAMGNPLIPAIAIERLFAGNAHLRHQAARPIIDAGVDYLAVARRRDGADALGGFQHDHFAATLCQPPRHGQTDHSRTNDDALDLFHLKNSDPDLLWLMGARRAWSDLIHGPNSASVQSSGYAIFLSNSLDLFPNFGGPRC